MNWGGLLQNSKGFPERGEGRIGILLEQPDLLSNRRSRLLFDDSSLPAGLHCRSRRRLFTAHRRIRVFTQQPYLLEAIDRIRLVV